MSISAEDALTRLLTVAPDALWSVALRTTAHRRIDTAASEAEIVFWSLRDRKRRGEIFRGPTLEDALTKARKWAITHLN
jgi:hypothetical protein